MAEHTPVRFPGNSDREPDDGHMDVAGYSPAAPPQFDSFAGEEEGGGIDIRRYLAALLRYKWLIALITIGGTASAAGVSKLVDAEYRAEGTVWIEGDEQGGESRGPIRTGQLLDAASWVELLRSFEVLEHVVNERHLFIAAENPSHTALLSAIQLDRRFATGRYRFQVTENGSGFRLALEGAGAESGTWGDSAGAGYGLHWVPEREDFRSGMEVAFSVRHPRDAAIALRERLNARIDRDGNFMLVDLMGDDPQAVAANVNAILDRYIELAADLKRTRLTAVRDILDDQLETAADNLEEAEVSLERFRVNTITLPTERSSPLPAGLAETRDPVFSSFFGMKVEQEQLRQDREALLRIVDPGNDSTLSMDALEFIDSARRSSELQGFTTALRDKRANLTTLLTRYTTEHPLVVQAQREVTELEEDLIPAQIRQLAAVLGTRVNELGAQIDQVSGNLQAIPQRTIEQARLQRAVNIAENLYTELRGRAEAARLAEASSLPDVQILSRAVEPDQPIANKAQQLILMGFAASLGLAVGVAILLDRFDRRFRYPEQITKDLGLQILGAIPRAQNGRRGLKKADMNQIVEALRGIRMNVVHSHGTAGPVQLTITSPGPGDGKSFVSSNLALAFAEAGHRTLLIDGDIRKGQLHRMFNVERKPGLTEVLTGAADANAAVRATTYAGLDILPCGTRTSKAPELLGSATMAKLFKSLRTRYGVIIVDSPPMGAGVDPFALGVLTGNLLLVVRTGATDRELAEAKLDTADRLPIRVLGAVLNDVRPGAGGGYYYPYYSYYLPGYEAGDEEVEDNMVVVHRADD